MNESTNSTNVDSSKRSCKYENLVKEGCIPNLNCVSMNGIDFERKLKMVGRSDSAIQGTEGIAEYGDVNITYTNITKQQFDTLKRNEKVKKQIESLKDHSEI